jgi:hypothetical protein
VSGLYFEVMVKGTKKTTRTVRDTVSGLVTGMMVSYNGDRTGRTVSMKVLGLSITRMVS